MATRQDRLTVDVQGYREALETFAEKTHRSAGGVIRMFIEEGLKRHAPELLNLDNKDFDASKYDAMAETYALVEFLKAIAKHEQPTASSLLITAKMTGIIPEDLAKLVHKKCGDSNEPSDLKS